MSNLFKYTAYICILLAGMAMSDSPPMAMITGVIGLFLMDAYREYDD